jgi:hypothetical protein
MIIIDLLFLMLCLFFCCWKKKKYVNGIIENSVFLLHATWYKMIVIIFDPGFCLTDVRDYASAIWKTTRKTFWWETTNFHWLVPSRVNGGFGFLIKQTKPPSMGQVISYFITCVAHLQTMWSFPLGPGCLLSFGLRVLPVWLTECWYKLCQLWLNRSRVVVIISIFFLIFILFILFLFCEAC